MLDESTADCHTVHLCQGHMAQVRVQRVTLLASLLDALVRERAAEGRAPQASVASPSRIARAASSFQNAAILGLPVRKMIGYTAWGNTSRKENPSCSVQPR